MTEQPKGDPPAASNVVSIHDGAPSARFKRLDHGDTRASCRHQAVMVWRREPILECATCGGVVDPWQWIRDCVEEWDRVERHREMKVKELDREIEARKKQLRLLRSECASEIERREAERAVAILPPQRGRRSV